MVLGVALCMMFRAAQRKVVRAAQRTVVRVRPAVRTCQRVG
jgi:hypothetical protein